MLLENGADRHGVGGRCEVCRMPGTERDPLEVDHIQPFALGGDDSRANLRCIHRSENRRLGSRVARELQRRRRAQ